MYPLHVGPGLRARAARSILKSASFNKYDKEKSYNCVVDNIISKGVSEY
jgi:hypothetical protein